MELTEAARTMATAKRGVPTTIRVSSTTRDALEKLKRTIAGESASYDQFLQQLAEIVRDKAPVEVLQQLAERRVQLDAAEFDLDLGPELDPLRARIDQLEELLKPTSVRHQDFNAPLTFIGLFYVRDSKPEYVFHAPYEHDVSEELGAWLKIPYNPRLLVDTTLLSERAKNLPPAIANAIHAEEAAKAGERARKIAAAKGGEKTQERTKQK